MPWDLTDIRRNLPNYRTREGDVVYGAPYRATEADLNAFVLEADLETLQRLVNDQLNVLLQEPALLGSQRDLKFTCTEGWVVLLFAALLSVESEDKVDRSRGTAGALELSIWVPLVKEQRVAGAMSAEPAWYLPLLYTAPTSSVSTGREVFGFPKVPAYLPLPYEEGPPNGVNVRPSLPGKKPPPVFEVKNNPVVTQMGLDASLLEQPLMRTVVARYFDNCPIVFRKQAGIAEDNTRAGYTALIESHIPISRMRVLAAIGPDNGAGMLKTVAEQVTKNLGIQSENPLQGAAIRGCTLDIQQGSEIWVAAKPLEYVRPMPAPGNELMRGNAAGRAFDLLSAPVFAQELKRASKTRRGQPPDLNGLQELESAVGEVYFAKPLPRAIDALLARDFPGQVPAQSGLLCADPQRQFIALCFLRANLIADNVKLYEFSVLVPVRHGEERAWYIPFIYRSPGVAVVHAREWFGHPCQEAFIDFKSGDSYRTVTLISPQSVAPQIVQWVEQTGIEITDINQKPDKEPHRPWLNAFLGERQTVVGLLQTRHATDTSRACFQANVRSTRTMRAERSTPLSGKFSLKSGVSLGHLLNLDGSKTLYGYALEGVTLTSTLPSLIGA